MSNKYADIENAFKAYKSKRLTPDKVDEGWFTSRELAEQKKLNYREAQRVVRELLDSGLVEIKKFNIVTGTRLYPVVHYKLCKKKTR